MCILMKNKSNNTNFIMTKISSISSEIRNRLIQSNDSNNITVQHCITELENVITSSNKFLSGNSCKGMC